MDYNQIPAYPDGGKPTKFKDWIAKIVDEIQAIKGTTNHYDPVPMSLLQLSQGQGHGGNGDSGDNPGQQGQCNIELIVREFSITTDLFQIESESGLYKYRLNHGLNSINYTINVVDTSNRSVTHSIDKLSTNEIDVYLIENIECKVIITLINKTNQE